MSYRMYTEKDFEALAEMDVTDGGVEYQFSFADVRIFALGDDRYEIGVLFKRPRNIVTQKIARRSIGVEDAISFSARKGEVCLSRIVLSREGSESVILVTSDSHTSDDYRMLVIERKIFDHGDVIAVLAIVVDDEERKCVPDNFFIQGSA